MEFVNHPIQGNLIAVQNHYHKESDLVHVQTTVNTSIMDQCVLSDMRNTPGPQPAFQSGWGLHIEKEHISNLEGNHSSTHEVPVRQ